MTHTPDPPRLPALSRRLDQPWLAALVVAAVWTWLVLARVAQAGGDPSGLVLAAATRCDPAQVPASLHLQPAGYDGQYYYAMAVDPFTWQSPLHGVTFDKPPYRLQRVLYPLLAWLVSGGQADRLPVALLVVNVLAAAAVGGLAGAWLRRRGVHALMGVVVGLSPTFAFTLSRDLTEVVEAALLLAGWLALDRRQFWRAGLWLALAVLARDTAIFAAGAVLLAGVWHKRAGDDTVRAPAWAVPLAVFALWQAALTVRWGQAPFLAGGGNLVAPGTGLRAFLSTLRLHTTDGTLWHAELAVLVLLLATTLWALRHPPTPAHVRVTWLVYAVFPLLWSTLIWSEDWAFMRGLTELWLVSLLVLLARRTWWTVPALVANAWLVVAVVGQRGGSR